MAVNAATYVGYNCAGYAGALAATTGVALPSFVLVTVVYYFINRFRESKAVDGAFAGIRPVTCGLIAAAVVFMGQSAFAVLDPVTVCIALGTVVLAGKFKVKPDHHRDRGRCDRSDIMWVGGVRVIIPNEEGKIFNGEAASRGQGPVDGARRRH